MIAAAAKFAAIEQERFVVVAVRRPRTLRRGQATVKTDLKLSYVMSRHYNIVRNCCSSRIGTPNFRAFSSFEPGSRPASTKSVFLLTDELMRPPRCSIRRV